MVRSLTQATPTGQSERVVQAHRILVGILAAAAAVGTISRLFTCKLLCKGYFLFVLVIFRPFYESLFLSFHWQEKNAVQLSSEKFGMSIF